MNFGIGSVKRIRYSSLVGTKGTLPFGSYPNAGASLSLLRLLEDEEGVSVAPSFFEEDLSLSFNNSKRSESLVSFMANKMADNIAVGTRV